LTGHLTTTFEEGYFVSHGSKPVSKPQTHLHRRVQTARKRKPDFRAEVTVRPPRYFQQGANHLIGTIASRDGKRKGEKVFVGSAFVGRIIGWIKMGDGRYVELTATLSPQSTSKGHCPYRVKSITRIAFIVGAS